MSSGRAIRLYIFGDSICFGHDVSPHLVWATRLAAALDQEFSPAGHKVTVQNPSINGNTTRMGLERFAFDVQSHKPDIAYIQFGMNDCHYWDTDRGLPRVSPAAFRDNLIELVQRARQHGAKHVFLPTNHVTPRTETKLVGGLGPTYEESNMRYADILRDVAKATGASLIDTRRAFEARMADGTSIWDLVLPDAIHLSPLGHELYFKEIHAAIREAVKAQVAQ